MEPYTIKNLPELLSFYLGNSKSIKKYEVSRLTAPGEYFGSVMLKVDILLTNNKTGGEEMLYAVAKMLPESELFRKIFKVQETFLNEMAFYEIIVPTLHDFQRRVGVTNVLDCFSECLATRKNLLGGSCIIDDDAVLIFENLMADGFINIDRFEGFDLDTTQLILRDMALFHAVPLALRMKKPEVFRNYIEPYCNRFREGQDIMDPMIRASEAVLKENKAVASWAYKVNESFYKPRCASREPFVTLIHTDLWTNNTMQKFVDRKPVANKFIDFQGFYYGSPASDLLFFLWSSVPKEVLELHFDDLIKYYYDHFIKAVNDHRVIDSRLNFQNFMREIEIEFEYEFGHALVYCLTVVSSKAGSRNMSELGTPEDYLKRITLKEKENAWFIVRDSERRGWLRR